MAAPHAINWLNQPGYTGETINPIRAMAWPAGIRQGFVWGTHCEKAGPGCANCYAERHNQRCLPGGGTGLPYTRASREKVEIYLDNDKLDKVRRWRKPRCIFWCSMTDMFGEWVPAGMTRACLDVMAETPRHQHIILTKRPEWANRWKLDLAWILGSASTQETVDAATEHMIFCQAPVVGLSLEPLLEPVTIPQDYWHVLNWILVGCESGPHRRPCSLAWVRSIVEQCRDAKVACYVKQLPVYTGVPPDGPWYASSDPNLWPEDLQVQEFPK